MQLVQLCYRLLLCNSSSITGSWVRILADHFWYVFLNLTGSHKGSQAFSKSKALCDTIKRYQKHPKGLYSRNHFRKTSDLRRSSLWLALALSFPVTCFMAGDEGLYSQDVLFSFQSELRFSCRVSRSRQLWIIYQDRWTYLQPKCRRVEPTWWKHLGFWIAQDGALFFCFCDFLVPAAGRGPGILSTGAASS